MIFEFLGQTGDSIAFRTIYEDIKRDFGVFDADYYRCTNKEEYTADMLLTVPTGIELEYEHVLVTDRTDYFEGVDITDNEAFTAACINYLTEKQGFIFE